MKHLILFSTLLLASLLQPLYAEEAPPDTALDNNEVAQEISDLKEQVIKLNRDLFILQEELLFPAETQVAVFVSVDSGAFFKIDSIELRLDDKKVTNYLYTEHEQQALARGGIQRLWVGNIKSGEHELVAFCKGLNNEGRAMERATAINFSKDDENAAMLEIKIIDSNADMRAHFSIEQWES